MVRLLTVDRYCRFAVKSTDSGDDAASPLPCACFTINGVRSNIAVKYDLHYSCFTVNGVRTHLAARINGIPAYPCVSLRATCTCIGVRTRTETAVPMSTHITAPPAHAAAELDPPKQKKKYNPHGANTSSTTYKGGCSTCGQNISYH